MSTSVKTTASHSFLIAALVLLVSGVILPETIGAMRSDYTSLGNFISELGARGAHNSKIINWFGFLPVAISSGVLIFSLRSQLKGYALARLGLVLLFVGISVGYFGAFLFPCDYGCPLEGSPRQMIHNLAGAIEYPTGTLGLVLLGIGLKDRLPQPIRILVFIVAALSALGFIMMISPDQESLRGFWQRLADYSMFSLILFLGWLLHRKTRERLPQSNID